MVQLVRMITELEKKLNKIFTKKFPVLPKNVKGIIVKYGPYLAVVMLILSIPTVLALIGVIITATSFTFGGTRGVSYVVSILLGLVMMILEAMAIPGLFKRQIKAWELLFYVSLVSAVSDLLNLDIVSLIIGTGLSWYILFQIKSYYK